LFGSNAHIKNKVCDTASERAHYTPHSLVELSFVMKHHLIPAEETRTEINVVNSRFIATIAPVFSVSEAKSYIYKIKVEFSDASHNVPAYVIGHGPSTIAHCNDDGEPSGTAGRPALAVLQGSGIGDAAVVVTRYFGGTKLGKGGLVRAYTNAVQAVLEVMPKAEKISTYTIMVALPYSLFDRIKLLIQGNRGKILDQEFAAEVTITILFAEVDFPAFQAALSEISKGAIMAEIIEQNHETIMPLGSF
jgi:uncharacterized YigZ family protein